MSGSTLAGRDSDSLPWRGKRWVHQDDRAQLHSHDQAKPMSRQAWMLDGYPRTIPQAEALDKILPALGQKIDVVLNVDVPDAELIKRVTGRRMCKCGTTYHVQFNPNLPDQVGALPGRSQF